MTNDEIWHEIRGQRLVVADLLESLDEEQWNEPSLCDGWRVRDVAAHLTLATRANPVHAAVGLLKARGDFNRYVRDDAISRGSRSPAELIRELRAVAGSRNHPPGTRPADPLVDVLVHGQDIARPLGIDLPMPLDAARTAVDRVWNMGFPFRARRRLAARGLVATDTDWTSGVERAGGATLEAPIAELLLLMTGRAGVPVSGGV